MPERIAGYDKHVAEVAQAAFWAVVAKMYPEIKTGDFAPFDQMVFDLNCEKAVKTWVQSNA